MFKNFSLFLLRISLGGLFVYAGISKIMDPAWSAVGYLSGAKTFPGLYHWFASPGVIQWVNLLNEWGLALIGASLIIGLFVRWSSLAGILMMLLYYFPILQFPYVGEHSYIVDEHIIYICAFLVFIAYSAGTAWGLDYFRKSE